MTKIKMCGLSRPEDIEKANDLNIEYIGFVFAKKSKRYVTPETAKELKSRLKEGIKAVGVFVDEEPENVAELLKEGIIDIAQLHGNEDEEYIKTLRSLTDAPIIKAFTVKAPEDVKKAEASSADMILLDSGKGSGMTFNWQHIKDIKRPYFLAGGLSPENAAEAVRTLHPYALDVSSGIETDGKKDPEKMKRFKEKAKEA